MTPHKQLNRHAPDQGIIGDCWRTCIACLLDMHPLLVPHFFESCWDDDDATRANAATRLWLAERGLSFVEFPYAPCELPVLQQSFAYNCPDVHYILSGTSKNNVGHSVIGLNDRIVWDPSLDDSGIVGPMRGGYYWFGLLIPMLIVAKGAV